MKEGGIHVKKKKLCSLFFANSIHFSAIDTDTNPSTKATEAPRILLRQERLKYFEGSFWILIYIIFERSDWVVSRKKKRERESEGDRQWI